MTTKKKNVNNVMIKDNNRVNKYKQSMDVHSIKLLVSFLGRGCDLLLQCHARVIQLPRHPQLAKLTLVEARKRARAQSHQVGEADIVQTLLQLRPIVIDALQQDRRDRKGKFNYWTSSNYYKDFKSMPRVTSLEVNSLIDEGNLKPNCTD